MDLDRLARMEPAALRMIVPAFVSGYIEEPAAAARNRARMSAFLAQVDDVRLRKMVEDLAALGNEQRLYPANPDARRFSREWCHDLITDGVLTGAQHLDAALKAGPTVVLCNHLSYFDTQGTDALLAWNGREDLADRLVAVAGPKVYADLFRRFAALTLNTLPAPQSTQLGTDAGLGQREVARRATETLKHGHEAVQDGFALLVYPEGTRSRTGRLRPFLRAIARYLEGDGVQVVPAAQSGTDGVFPVDRDRLRPGTVRLALGAPLSVAAVGGPREALEAAHHAIAALLPEAARPLPGDPPVA